RSCSNLLTRNRRPMAIEELPSLWERPPPRPVLYANTSPEAEEARALLQRYDIDFDTRRTDGPAIGLAWNGTAFTDSVGVVHVLALARGAVRPLRETGGRGCDEASPGTRIPLEKRRSDGVEPMTGRRPSVKYGV